MKKIISLATILTVAAMVAGPGVNAATTAELQAQINTLMATLAGLQAQLTAQGGSTGAAPAACAGVTLSANLTVGSTGTAVKCLQAFLNASATTQVATTGAGSPGSETTYFGNLTKVAVAKYQTAHAIAPAAGYFGPLTRASVNAALASGVPGVTPPGTAPVGCTSATEGSYTATLSASPVGRTVSGGAKIEVYGVDVKAYNSDITVGSIDLQTSAVNATTAAVQDPSTFITKINVYESSVADANLIKSFSPAVFTLDAASVYYASLTGLNLKVANGATKKVLITFDMAATSDQNRTVTVNIYGNGIRGRDCVGIDRFTALATTRVLTVQPASTATLTLTRAADNPNSAYIKSDVTSGVQTKETLLSLNAKATSGAATLSRLTITSATAASNAVPSILYLYDGTTMVQSCNPASGDCTFENFQLPITQDETKNLLVKADWAATDGQNSVTVTGNAGAADLRFNPTILVTGAGSVFMSGNGLVQSTTVSAQINGNTMFIRQAGAKMTFVSGTATVQQKAIAGDPNIVTGTLKLNITPFGGEMDELTLATGDATSIVDSSNIRVMAYFATGGYLYTCAPFGLTRTLQHTVIGRSVQDGETDAVTVNIINTMVDSSTYSGWSIRFKVEGGCFGINVGAAGSRCIGQADELDTGANDATGNMTDNFVTNWIVLP